MSRQLPQIVWPPHTLWRVARLGMGTTFSELGPVDAMRSSAGNRFDVVGSGVLYASTMIEGCYREVLARLRPARGMSHLDEDSGLTFMPAGQVAASWRANRRRFALTVGSDLPFIDVEAQETWNAIEATPGALPPTIDHLDIGHVRGSDRRLTRLIALWAYAQGSPDGRPLYAGIRYVSRTGDFECWAIFERPEVQIVETQPAGEIDLSEDALSRVCQDYGLTLY